MRRLIAQRGCANWDEALESAVLVSAFRPRDWHHAPANGRNARQRAACTREKNIQLDNSTKADIFLVRLG